MSRYVRRREIRALLIKPVSRLGVNAIRRKRERAVALAGTRFPLTEEHQLDSRYGRSIAFEVKVWKRKLCRRIHIKGENQCNC
jgi:hypothetical protein